MPREEIRSNRSTSPTGSEFFNALQEMSRDWMGRATAEVELGLKLSKNLLPLIQFLMPLRPIRSG